MALATVKTFGEKGWRSEESTRLPPMWLRFYSRTLHYMWVEFVVGSHLCSKRFFAAYSGFPLSSKTTFPNSNLIRNLRATGLSVVMDSLRVTLVKESLFLSIYFIMTERKQEQEILVYVKLSLSFLVESASP